MAKKKLGAFEFHLVFAPTGGGDPVETVSTPSMWALADEWVDGLRAAGGHTAEWYDRQLGSAIFLQAARDLGLAPEGELSVAAIAEVLNAYDVEIADEHEPEGGGNPTTDAPGASQDAV